MTVKLSPAEAFRPPLALRLLEGARAARELLSVLPTTVALKALAGAAATAGPVQTRLRQEVSPPLTHELAVVDQAIAWTIALYRALRVQRPDALEVMSRVVVRSGVRLMERAFPRLDDDRPLAALERFVLPALEHAARHGLYRFEPPSRAADRLAFDMTYCHYAEACRVAGVPELARCFCDVDVPFFAGLSDRLTFSCRQRLAAGDPACTFVFSVE